MLFCFDCDGTLESSSGPVKVARMLELQRLGHDVVIVSPSPAHPKHPDGSSIFPRVMDKGARQDNLKAAAAIYALTPGVFKLYVSDNGDQAEAIAAGFAFMHPNDFR